MLKLLEIFSRLKIPKLKFLDFIFLAIFISALGIALLWHLQNKEIPNHDSIRYMLASIKFAINFQTFDVFNILSQFYHHQPSNLTSPVIHSFLGFPFFIFFSNPLFSVAAFNLVLLILTLIIIYKFSRLDLSPSISTLVTANLVFWPNFLGRSHLYMSELPLIFFAVTAYYFFYKKLKTAEKSYSSNDICFLLFSGLCIAQRPVEGSFLVVPLLLHWIFNIKISLKALILAFLPNLFGFYMVIQLGLSDSVVGYIALSLSVFNTLMLIFFSQTRKTEATVFAFFIPISFWTLPLINGLIQWIWGNTYGSLGAANPVNSPLDQIIHISDQLLFPALIFLGLLGLIYIVSVILKFKLQTTKSNFFLLLVPSISIAMAPFVNNADTKYLIPASTLFLLFSLVLFCLSVKKYPIIIYTLLFVSSGLSLYDYIAINYQQERPSLRWTQSFAHHVYPPQNFGGMHIATLKQVEAFLEGKPKNFHFFMLVFRPYHELSNYYTADILNIYSMTKGLPLRFTEAHYNNYENLSVDDYVSSLNLSSEDYIWAGPHNPDQIFDNQDLSNDPSRSFIDNLTALDNFSGFSRMGTIDIPTHQGKVLSFSIYKKPPHAK